MNAVDRNLLLRIARRVEEAAEEAYKAVPIGADALVHKHAKAKRDREIGDAKDVREYVKRMEAEEPARTRLDTVP